MGDYILLFFSKTILLDTIPPCKHMCKLYLRIRNCSLTTIFRITRVECATTKPKIAIRLQCTSAKM